jgi:3'(2'), 5'-bisphosphate nucleotidase
MGTFEQEIRTAVAAVSEAAVLCRAVQADIGPDVLEKKDRSPVTVADYGSQALICRALHERYPDDPIIAEEDSAALREAGNGEILSRVVSRVGVDADTVCSWIDHGGAREYSDRFWTLDPIDGTKGFLRGEQYAVALALIVNGEVAVAAMACPNLPFAPGGERGEGTVFSAVRGQGAHALSPGADPAPIRVSDRDDPAVVRFCESVESGHSSHGDSARVAEMLGITAEPVRLDSQAKYAVVGRGEADIYMRLPTRPGYVEKIWDHAAGSMVIREAGGTVTDVHGNPLDFSRGSRLTENRGVLATNGRLHERVLAALREVGV